MLRSSLLALLLLCPGCIHRRHYQQEWNSIWEGWQIESRDDCDYINSFKKSDCLKRHNVKL